jgi:hypothetical protein
LPGGGWPGDALTEVLSAHEGVGEVRLVLPALARVVGEGRWLAWVGPPYLPYAPALAAAGVDLGRVLLVRPPDGGEALWAVEQALRSGVCGAVLAWPDGAVVDGRLLRRLQLAAGVGRAWGVLFRSPERAREPSPAALRLLVEPSRAGMTARILKCRGRGPSTPLRLGALAGGSGTEGPGLDRAGTG